MLLTLPHAPSLLPFCSAQFDQVEARFENGMLQVKFPKKAMAAVVNPSVRVRLPSFLMRPAPLTFTDPLLSTSYPSLQNIPIMHGNAAAQSTSSTKKK